MDIVLISGFDRRVLNAARELGLSKGMRIRGTLTKPIDIDDLEAMLRSLRPCGLSPGAYRPAVTFGVDEIREGLARNEFVPRYQPKLILDEEGQTSGTIGSAEVLVRWHHPTLGELSPDRFLPVLEAEGLVGEMTDRLLDQVLEHAVGWGRMGCSPDLSINLSPTMLHDLSLPDRYNDRIQSAGLSADLFTFEIVESAAMADVVATGEILTRFRLKGFGLSLDDFGTGYSSLVELYRLPFCELKIDRLFGSKALVHQEADVIVRLLVNLANGLGVASCAEGAEDDATLAYLSRIGCQRIQGYAIDRPLTPEAFTERLGAVVNWLAA